MNTKIWWYTARAGGIVSFALVALAVIWGLMLSLRMPSKRPTPRWLLDLHRMLGGLAVVFTGVHLAGLVADSYVHFGPASLFVPLASHWKPGPVALGVIGLYLMLAIEITSLLMRHLSRRAWKRVHLTSYVLFWIAAIHGSLAGTDAANPVYAYASAAAIAVVVVLTLARLVAPRRRRTSPVRRPAAPEPREGAPAEALPEPVGAGV